MLRTLYVKSAQLFMGKLQRSSSSSTIYMKHAAYTDDVHHTLTRSTRPRARQLIIQYS